MYINSAFPKKQQVNYPVNAFSRKKRSINRNHVKFDRETDLPSALFYYAEIAELEFNGYGGWVSVICPFHDDTNPSLQINLDFGGFRCMACGAGGGDVLAFHRLKHEVSFQEAVKAMKKFSAMEGK